MRHIRRLSAFISGHMPFIVPVCLVLGIAFPQVLGPAKVAVPYLFAIITFQGSLNTSLHQVVETFRHPRELLAILSVTVVLMPARARSTRWFSRLLRSSACSRRSDSCSAWSWRDFWDFRYRTCSPWCFAWDCGTSRPVRSSWCNSFQGLPSFPSWRGRSFSRFWPLCSVHWYSVSRVRSGNVSTSACAWHDFASAGNGNGTNADSRSSARSLRDGCFRCAQCGEAFDGASCRPAGTTCVTVLERRRRGLPPCPSPCDCARSRRSPPCRAARRRGRPGRVGGMRQGFARHRDRLGFARRSA